MAAVVHKLWLDPRVDATGALLALYIADELPKFFETVLTAMMSLLARDRMLVSSNQVLYSWKKAITGLDRDQCGNCRFPHEIGSKFVDLRRFDEAVFCIKLS